MPTKASDLVVAGHVLLSSTELNESVAHVMDKGFLSLLDYVASFQTAQAAAPLTMISDENWRSWINMFRVQTDISDTRWIFVSESFYAKTKKLSLTHLLEVS